LQTFQGLILVAVTSVEVKVIEDAERNCDRIDGPGGGDGRTPVLELGIGFESDVVGDVVVQPDAGGVYDGVGGEVDEVAGDESGFVVVDLATTDEKVGIGMILSDGVFDFGAEEEVFLAADVAFVDGIGATKFKGRPEGVKREDGKVSARGDSEVFSAFEIGEGACACEEG
jgi:hypothetical protein